MKLQFCGATGTVTGSKYLLDVAGVRLLVDCGLFQGLKELREQNWRELPFDPTSVDAVLLTHAHIDHSGMIPLLVKNGFKGKIYASQATIDLCAIMLPDSGRLQEEDAERANRYGYTRHKPALPLYTEDDANKALEYFHPVSFGQSFVIRDEVKISFHRAGHILGASFIRVDDGKTVLLFSGDMGRAEDDVMLPPAEMQEADYLVLESTYGDRLHPKINPIDQIEEVILRTVKRGGTIVIPAFAVGRTQQVLFCIYKLKKEGRIPDALPVFVDSPMATDATEVFRKHVRDHNLSNDLCHEVCAVATYIRSVEESKALDASSMPSVIISASGMATGGRVLHHLKHFMIDPRNTILFTGYQAAGTRGANMVQGEKHIKIHGELFPVRAEILNLDNMSAHADYEEILGWLSHFRKAPKHVFLTHGEVAAAEALKQKIATQYGWDVTIPAYLDAFDLY